ncbi:hypothetical protein PFISCL1PPCAC_1620, partial [Pristionchus fissidentatus]
FNLFSDRPASPVPSIFNIDPTGVSTGSTVSVTGSEPESTVSTESMSASFWDTVPQGVPSVNFPISSPDWIDSLPSLCSKTSCISCTRVFRMWKIMESTVSTTSANCFETGRPVTSTTSTLFVDPCEVSMMDPSSIDSFTSTSSSSLCPLLIRDSLSLLNSSISSSSLFHHSPKCDFYSLLPTTTNPSHSDLEVSCSSSSDVITSADSISDFERSHHTFIVSNSVLDDEGYSADVDSEPVLIKWTTTVSSTQTEQSNVARMLEECDDIMEKIVEMKKRLKKLLIE